MDAGIVVTLKVWLTVYASLCYCYIIGKSKLVVIPKGIPRLICILPVVVLFFYLPLLIPYTNLSGNTAFLVTWLGSSKLLLFAFDRGPLASSSMSLPLFAAIASLPIKIIHRRPDDPPLGNHQASSFKSLLPHAIKAAGLGLLFRAYEYRDSIHPRGILLLYAFHIYFTLELILAVLAATTRALLGLELEPQFDEPYKSSSLQDFWGRRWNLMVTGILRPTVYEPVLRASARFTGRKWPAVPAVLATFLVSGLMHELLFFYMSCARPTWEVTSFFVLHGICLMVEMVARRKLLRLGWRVPRVVATVLTVGFVLVTAFKLFFPPLLKSNVDRRALQEFEAVAEFVKKNIIIIAARISKISS